MSREKAIGYGYIITDEQGRVQLHTLRSNRQESWNSLSSKQEMRREWKKRGFRCVPVYLEEAAWHWFKK
jgi:hypothetical protein